MRQEFELSVLFGMPGVDGKPGCLKKKDDGTYLKPSVEKVYSIWLRGYNSGVHAERGGNGGSNKNSSGQAS